jgi:NADH-quinone oxidoreductase subunit N
MSFVSPVLNYAQLAPILIIFAGALIGVFIEAFAPRSARHSSQLFIAIFSLVSAFAALMTVRNQASADTAMGSIAFDGAGVLIQAAILIIAFLAIFLIADQENFTAMAAAVPGSDEERQALQGDLRVTEGLSTDFVCGSRDDDFSHCFRSHYSLCCARNSLVAALSHGRVIASP